MMMLVTLLLGPSSQRPWGWKAPTSQVRLSWLREKQVFTFQYLATTLCTLAIISALGALFK